MDPTLDKSSPKTARAETIEQRKLRAKQSVALRVDAARRAAGISECRLQNAAQRFHKSGTRCHFLFFSHFDTATGSASKRVNVSKATPPDKMPRRPEH